MSKVITFKASDFKHYLVTGRYYNSTKKFRKEIKFYWSANCINLWNGRIRGVTHEGKYKLLKTVIN